MIEDLLSDKRFVTQMIILIAVGLCFGWIIYKTRDGEK